eukprot:359419-Prymnesium_polylepis.1
MRILSRGRVTRARNTTLVKVPPRSANDGRLARSLNSLLRSNQHGIFADEKNLLKFKRVSTS